MAAQQEEQMRKVFENEMEVVRKLQGLKSIEGSSRELNTQGEQRYIGRSINAEMHQHNGVPRRRAAANLVSPGCTGPAEGGRRDGAPDGAGRQAGVLRDEKYVR